MLGQIYVYRPSMIEVKVAMGIFAIGFLIFTLMTKIAMNTLVKGIDREERW